MTAPLISAGELRRWLAGTGRDPRPVLLDVRWELATGPQPAAYEAGHIPGAAFLDLDRDLAAPAGPGGRHPLPDPEQLQSALRAAGVSGDTPVVVYDAASGMPAARGWWVLRYFGHQAVRVLEGGLAAWTAAGGTLATGREPAPGTSGTFTARPGHMPMLDAAGAAALADRAGGILLDARAPERFRGETEPVDPVAGHIPGAANLPVADAVDPDGHFAEPAAVRARLTRLAADPAAAVGAYCGSGVSAAQLVLALEHAGIEAALYPGSWSEWIADPTRPVATGPD